MKKIFTIFAALTLSAGLWAEAPANVESVDLGLPSGTKWATFNVGATTPEGYGDYFAWGETEPYYSSQDPITWKTGKETGYAWQSYCGSSSFTEWSTAPYDATTKILKPEYDAATANWGSDWRMPTKDEINELLNECDWEWTEDNNGTGVKGYIVKSKAAGNNNSIFLPASGYRSGSSLDDVESFGYYWSSSLNASYSDYADCLGFVSEAVDWSYYLRCTGLPVRPVYAGPVTVNVAYLDPVYNDPTDVTKGIKEWKNATADATVVENATEVITWGTAGTTTWYVVTGENVTLDQGAVCNGAVNLILADGAKLTATGKTAPGEYTPGIQVLGEGNSLIIYGQTAQSGQLIANGGENAAGIGGSGQINKGNGSNITINGGIVTATGGQNGAGIGGGYAYNGSSGSNITINGGTVTATGGGGGAGIGGGYEGSGSNITINGGIVTANSEYAAGIGGGYGGSASNIFVATSLAVKADNNNPPTTVIENDGSDLASKLAGKRYATVETPAAPEVGDQFEDATSGLKFEVTAVEGTPTVKVIANNYTGTTYTIPDTVKYNGVDFTVTEIFGAFENCENLESVTLPATLTTIGMFAFSGCASLQSVTLPASVTTIKSNAFRECTSLQSITLPANLTEIESSAFSLCTGLQSITIPTSVATIGEWAFSQRSIPGPPTIPARIATIGKRASQNSSALTSVTFLGNACQDAIGNNAFYGVGETAPAALTLPDTWTGSTPDEDGNWYSGKFELVSGPTALPTVFGDGVKGNKFMHKGHLIIRSGNKKYNVLGTEVQ